MRKVTAERKAKGLCACGAKPSPGYKSCAVCREKTRRKSEKTAAKRKAKAVCVQCGTAPPAAGKLRCDGCRAYQKQYQKQYHEDRKAAKTKRRPELGRAWWRRLRLAVFDRDGWRCQLCGNAGRLECDHRDGNPDNHEMDNLRTLCRTCHIEVTRKQNRRPDPEMESWQRLLVDLFTS
ncbi:MAG: HNH endonuclease signature motif containing protein [Gammaproteobacteria bacterium]|nr:HNH endonuclease signature motif containing protein [Gammaproteobacteria bacterium]